MRTRIASLLVVGLAVGAFGASLVDSYAQNLDRVARNRHATDSTPAKKSAAKNAATKPPPVEPEKLTRPEFTAAEEAAAEVPGMPGVRFWADSIPDFERALPQPQGPWLVLSTGGAEGAYGAGFLNGWSAAGTRPQFAAITGVSTGALMATYVFAGAQYDEELHHGYTEITASDIFEIGATPESLTDAWPLQKLIEKRVTPQMLAAIAAEHAKGRRLFVVTTNLDAGRPMVWNMGAIAAKGGEAALKLFRQVLLASASIEGLFQPVYITVEASGRQFQEMHADGGATGPLFIAPVPYLMPGATQRLPASEYYVIVNGKMSDEFYMPLRNTTAILGRAISVALAAGGRLQLALGSVAAKRAGIPFNVSYVGDNFEQAGRGLFDPKYMGALYDYGFAQGRSDSRFHSAAFPHAPGSPTASGAPKPQ